MMLRKADYFTCKACTCKIERHESDEFGIPIYRCENGYLCRNCAIHKSGLADALSKETVK